MPITLSICLVNFYRIALIKRAEGAYTIDLDDGERQIEFTGSADCARCVFHRDVLP